jgi:hypothetical protein
MKKKFFHAPIETKPSRPIHVDAPKCAFCSQLAITHCEYPKCGLLICKRCRVRKGGGNLCRHHKDARLLQELGVPMIGDVAKLAAPGRFKHKGPAVPHGTA